MSVIRLNPDQCIIKISERLKDIYEKREAMKAEAIENAWQHKQKVYSWWPWSLTKPTWNDICYFVAFECDFYMRPVEDKLKTARRYCNTALRNKQDFVDLDHDLACHIY